MKNSYNIKKTFKKGSLMVKTIIKCLFVQVKHITAIVLLLLFACSVDIQQEVYCSRVIDGDTIEVSYGLKTGTVRLIGIDASETFTHTNKYTKDIVECTKRGMTVVKCKAEIKTQSDIAKERLAQMVLHKNLYLKVIDKENPFDKYGRILAYVEVDGVDIGRQLLEEGLAKPTKNEHPRSMVYQLSAKK